MMGVATSVTAVDEQRQQQDQDEGNRKSNGEEESPFEISDNEIGNGKFMTIIPMRYVKSFIGATHGVASIGSLLLGGSKVNPLRFTEFLNMNAAEGWRVQTMEKDIRRMLLFFKREAYVVILGRET